MKTIDTMDMYASAVFETKKDSLEQLGSSQDGDNTRDLMTMLSTYNYLTGLEIWGNI
jgi:hypothetical protein